ncbi:MAG: type I glutamate--ammonia ligase [Ignavibacteria bacterium RIFCSPLOWO2_02_FULL_55_14]|nr:MAG: type I glutamate--ammonia ligase [Ignavibacteria bacterium GWC2_56_12]OGU70654.1 MAG: type I glutamate--ammonia ligase [Ignavibacteria bacterium RIFCSPLOWO2_02_FULL_55_14]OGU73408.1 MAG: type I glutamate--ammonia ligase [Ignavibacteria bacterium RIFCSPLOWO2_12_FULL_56_21]
MAKSKGASEIEKVFKLMKDRDVKIVDLKFTDMLGQWHHFSVTTNEFSAETFEDGIGFDGSSIRGFQRIHESDMLLYPDPTSVFLDPFTAVPTISLTCDIADPITKEPYSRDPRYIAQKAESYLKTTGIADTAYFGPEPEFFILDNVRFDQSTNYSFYFVDSDEGIWNSGQETRPNLGHRPRYKEGYFPVAPLDTLQDLRSEMVLTLQSVGVDVEVHHHEVATAGQTEIDMRRTTLTKMADNYLLYKYVTKNVAKKNGKTVTFMPKPIFGDNGSGMHVHQSLWKAGKPLFAGTGYAGLSEMAMHYIGGILKHAPALCALTNPTTNSYKRLVPGYEAPVNLAYSQRNRSASVRIPMYSSNPKSKRIEFRCPDPICNPYLGFPALLMAGLDGIINKIDPGKPLDKDIYEMSPEQLRDVPNTPGSLEEALKALKKDHDFLLRGDVFTKDLIETWIEYKMFKEVKPMQLRPHPYEFMMYYDA